MTGIISIIISVLVTLFLFVVAKTVNPQAISFWLLLAKLSGLIGSILISWNFIIATKNSFVEKMFGGLDKAYKIHNIIGNIAFILLVNHPVFLIINSLPYNTTKIYLVPSFFNLPYAFGILALYTLILLVSLTIFIDLPYKFWKKTHEYIGIVIVLASLHSLFISSDVSSFLPLMLWILIWNIFAVLCYFYKRFFYYLINPKNNYVVKEIVQNGTYLLLTLAPIDSNKVINFSAGQFAFFSLSKDVRDDHPFSILEQGNEFLKLGTKIVGNFTVALSQLIVGSKISVVGPFGTFANNLFKAQKMLWVSGGIGITPFLSMAKSLDKNQQVTMVHTAGSNEPKLFVNLFTSYSKINPNFKFIIHYSDVSGHLDEEKLNTYMPLSKDVYVYLCGPKQMMKNLSDNLPKKGIMQKRIIFEDFSLK